MKRRVGDTLVEVTLAIGIFSMVAIAVVAVMTGGTSSAETALETTLAREEIDTQAEALRFIHSAYLAGIDSGSDVYTVLWDKIAERAIDPQSSDIDYLTYAPKTCQEVQNSNVLREHGFVINPRALSTDPINAYNSYYSNNTSGTIFNPASTFPRLIYNTVGEMLGTDNLVGNTIGDSLSRIEGIYVIAVKDPNTTQIVGNASPVPGSGFYDFYIRTCWYGAGANTPTTISTIIRLYNPPEIIGRDKSRVTIVYHSEGGPAAPIKYQVVPAGSSVNIARYENEPNFVSWNTEPTYNGKSIYWANNQCISDINAITNVNGQCVYTAPKNPLINNVLDLYAVWLNKIYFTSYFYANGGSWKNGLNNPHATAFSYGQTKDISDITSNLIPPSGKKFAGWKVTINGKDFWTCNDNNSCTLKAPDNPIIFGSDHVDLYAQWTDAPFTSYFYANGGSWKNGLNNPHATAFSYGQTKDISDITSNLIPPSGKKFAGWKVTINGKDFWTCNDNNSCTLTAPSDPITFGSDHVDLYAQWTPNKIYMQDITLNDCKVNVGSNGNPANVGDSITVYDKRESKDNYPDGPNGPDDASYTIRYINGACWMTQNLRITGTVSAQESNFTQPTSIKINNDGWPTEKNKYEPHLKDSRTSSGYYDYNLYKLYGVWYNACAATARTRCKNADTATGDICPRNWEISGSSGVGQLFGKNGTTDYYTGSFSPENSYYNAFSSVGSGVWAQGMLNKSGIWYGHNRSPNDSYYYMTKLSSGGVEINGYANYSYYGASVRCVLK